MHKDSIQIDDLHFEQWIHKQRIHERIEELAAEIRPFYDGKDLVVIGVLNGAVFFTIRLLRALGIPYRLDFIQASSYRGTRSTGEVKVSPIKENLKDSEVLIMEDIVDTGRTISVIKSEVMERGPASMRVASLFYKPEADKHDQQPDFVGFSIPDHFILGFGLDYNGKGRELEDVYKLVEKTKI